LVVTPSASSTVTSSEHVAEGRGSHLLVAPLHKNWVVSEQSTSVLQLVKHAVAPHT
jgi:hypothetical protein